jgi:hypothetical protein
VLFTIAIVLFLITFTINSIAARIIGRGGGRGRPSGP